ncbi:hypothetical protein [Cellulomonas xylanilytica]|uniref:Uncharacterized protein n=1 Tax=Cellulomonas xylanilytica TaxID=233583 RepID=A0A510V3G8_9CELL|nr:hypothetical protein [Cellulomonas xylanilytica]GEK21424.1 hypothetical protein CXY01_19440 [Cellulomonas xylanilytica]
MTGTRGGSDAERVLQRLLQPRPQFSVSFSRSVLASALWDLGEDDLADLALMIDDATLLSIQTISSWYEDRSFPLPVEGRQVTHNHVMALAAVTYLEGEVRPLARTRRRPAKDRPARFGTDAGGS